MSIIQTVFPFWPFAESVICVRCTRSVETRTAVPIVNVEGKLAGMQHPEDCG